MERGVKPITAKRTIGLLDACRPSLSFLICSLISRSHARMPHCLRWGGMASLLGGLGVGCRTFLSCISKGFGGFCSRLLRLRTGKLFSAFRLHGFADIF